MSDWTRAVAEVAWLLRRLGIPEPRVVEEPIRAGGWKRVPDVWRKAWDDAMGFRGGRDER